MMDDDKKREELVKLRKKIIDECFLNGWQDVWFYPPAKDAYFADKENDKAFIESGINGFMGVGEVIIIGINPSYGQFPSEKDKILYKLLHDSGFGKWDPHFTDLIKIRARGKSVSRILNDYKTMKRQMELLEDELSPLEPKLFIILGKGGDDPKKPGKIYKKVSESIISTYPDIPIESIWNMGYPPPKTPDKSSIEIWEDEVREKLKEIYERHKKVLNS